jgi:hypothetical protein
MAHSHEPHAGIDVVQAGIPPQQARSREQHAGIDVAHAGIPLQQAHSHEHHAGTDVVEADTSRRDGDTSCAQGLPRPRHGCTRERKGHSARARSSPHRLEGETACRKGGTASRKRYAPGAHSRSLAPVSGTPREHRWPQSPRRHAPRVSARSRAARGVALPHDAVLRAIDGESGALPFNHYPRRGRPAASACHPSTSESSLRRAYCRAAA